MYHQIIQCEVDHSSVTSIKSVSYIFFMDLWIHGFEICLFWFRSKTQINWFESHSSISTKHSCDITMSLLTHPGTYIRHHNNLLWRYTPEACFCLPLRLWSCCKQNKLCRWAAIDNRFLCWCLSQQRSLKQESKQQRSGTHKWRLQAHASVSHENAKLSVRWLHSALPHSNDSAFV